MGNWPIRPPIALNPRAPITGVSGFTALGYKKCPIDNCLYIKREIADEGASASAEASTSTPNSESGSVLDGLDGNGDDPNVKYTGRFVIAALYVDDVLCVHNWPEDSDRLKAKFTSEFELTNFNSWNWFLGWKCDRDRGAGTVKLRQGRLIREALNRFGMSNVKPKSTPLPASTVLEAPNP